MEKELITGIIYSKFNEKMGPKAFAWYPPNLSEEVKKIISLKTIDILSGESGKISKFLAAIPFPSVNSKGLVKSFEIKDVTKRGGAIDASLTLLFNEINDIIFYKYLQNFENAFKDLANKIIKMEEVNADKEQIMAEMEKFYSDILGILDELRESEESSKGKEAFPSLPDTEEKGYRFKIIVCGDPAVGKTSTILRFTDKAFRRTYIPTIGVNITEKQITYKNSSIIYILWDIAGQSKFERMRRHFYQGADGILLVFDLTREKTFKSILDWYQDIKNYLKENLRGFIIGNKCDLIDERKVTEEEISSLAEQLNLGYVETSALTGENVDEAFHKMADLLTE